MQKYCSRIITQILLLCCSAALLLAQGGTVHGIVVSSNAKPVPGAVVTATNPTTLSSFSSITNAAGLFDLGYLPPAIYTVSAQSKTQGKAMLPPSVVGNTGSVNLLIRLDGGAPPAGAHQMQAPVAPASNREPARILLQDITRALTRTFQTRKEPELTIILQQLLFTSRSVPDNYLLSADYFYGNNEFDRALKIYEIGLKAEKNKASVYQRKIAKTHILLGNLDQAATLIQPLLKDNPNDPAVQQLNILLSLFTGTSEDRATAIKAFETALATTPDNFEGHLLLARALLGIGKISAAQTHFQDAIDLRSGYLPARIGLAQLYLQIGDWSSALNAGSKALAISHDDVTGRLIRSSALVGVQQYTQARQELDDVFKLDPTSIEARYQSGFLYLKEKKLDDAEKAFRQVIVAAPADVRPIIGMAEVAFARGDSSAAIAGLKKEIPTSLKQLDLLNALGDLAARAKLYDEAIVAYSQILTKAPNNSDAHFRMASVYLSKQDNPNALAHLLRAAELSPTDPRIVMELALQHERMGNPAQAALIVCRACSTARR